MSASEGLELAIPQIGEVVNLDDYRSCAFALDAVRNLEAQLRYVKRELTDAIVAEAKKQGTKTLTLPDGRKASVSSDEEVVYNADRMEPLLREAGMPESRIREIIEETVTYRVKAVEAKRAANANSEYESIIYSCETVVPKLPSVSIRR